MSAYIVDTDHIDYLIVAAVESSIGSGGIYWQDGPSGTWARIDYTNADTIGAALLAENIASVSYRYGDDRESLPGPVPNPDPETYEFRPFSAGMVDTVQVLKALNCYEYQSCEHPGWKDSPAWRFVDALRGWMIARLPGYDDALWEVSRCDLMEAAIIERATVSADRVTWQVPIFRRLYGLADDASEHDGVTLETA